MHVDIDSSTQSIKLMAPDGSIALIKPALAMAAPDLLACLKEAIDEGDAPERWLVAIARAEGRE